MQTKDILSSTKDNVNPNLAVNAPKKRSAATGAISNDTPASSGTHSILAKAKAKTIDAKPSTPTVTEAEASNQVELDTDDSFPLLSLEDLLNMPPKEWLFEDFIGKGDTAVIFGDSASGKTFVVIDLIFAGCLGRTFAMRFEPSKQMNIAYCAGEGQGGLAARFNAAAAHYGVKKLPNFKYSPVVPQLYDSERKRDGIKKFITDWKQKQDASIVEALDILIIDTMHSAIVGAEENSSKDIGHIYDMCNLAKRTLGCAVLIVHHSNRAGTGPRGSGAIKNDIDSMIEIKTVEGKRTMLSEKLKDGKEWKAQTFSLVDSGDMDSVRVWWDEVEGSAKVNKSVKNSVIELLSTYPGKRFSSESIKTGTGAKSAHLTNVLKELVDEKKIKRDLDEGDKKVSKANPWLYYI